MCSCCIFVSSCVWVCVCEGVGMSVYVCLCNCLSVCLCVKLCVGCVSVWVCLFECVRVSLSVLAPAGEHHVGTHGVQYDLWLCARSVVVESHLQMAAHQCGCAWPSPLKPPLDLRGSAPGGLPQTLQDGGGGQSPGWFPQSPQEA